jgi:hypothetical protein
VAVALVLALAPSASAQTTNVIPNPGFEQGGCGSTPVICGWTSVDLMSQDPSNPHSGSASMHLECRLTGCGFDPDSGYIAADVTACVAIGPGTHPASFWYRDAGAAEVSLDATFYYDTACTYQVGGSDSLAETSPSGAGWQQVAGSLHAPTYTHSARFRISAACLAVCWPFASNFDDVTVDGVGDTTPGIRSVTPTRGWFGNRVELFGSNFVGASSVTFNGTEAQFSVQSDYVIHTYVPQGATTGPISVTTPNGTGWSSSSYTLVPPPRIDSFTPTGGPLGTTVDIRGSNFSGATEVRFKYSKSDSFTVDSDSEIHATVPYGATTGPITVTTGSGEGQSSSSFTIPTPTISSFTPTSGPVGTTIDIRGTNFTGATWVSFNGTRADVTVDSDSEIHTTVPSGATTGYFYVVTPGGSATSPSRFVVTGVGPSSIGFTPTSGSVGTSVDIWGAGFTGATSVTFNGASASFTVDSDWLVHATVPTGATNGPISVTTPLGTATSSASYTVDGKPPVTTITSGPSGTMSSTSATFEFSADEPASFECMLDAAPFASCSSPKTYTGLGTGSHVFWVRATDANGNIDGAGAKRTWTVDTNAPPVARFTYSCAALTCSFDAGASSDSDGSIAGYAWDFGDGVGGTGTTVQHGYGKADAFAVALKVTDKAGTSDTASKAITLIGLTARGYKVNSREKVDLSWTGPSGASFDVYRNGSKIATVQTRSYTDNLNRKGPGSFTYKVCQSSDSICSNPATVSF